MSDHDHVKRHVVSGAKCRKPACRDASGRHDGLSNPCVNHAPGEHRGTLGGNSIGSVKPMREFFAIRKLYSPAGQF
ncbi:hypothetical protein RCIA180 [Methanocella arvoryzae MRE50]|uniref:Uncharacterized protein n=1 Tax=Methanocella arvoryzae (strain DSM 22066 / NBRC 105507 / MRE50) TaxID=351160 RepID=Q0W284_METAR|nr:hypothetical protein RCIA180 [Methanocella arvoryzae MRE50]